METTVTNIDKELDNLNINKESNNENQPTIEEIKDSNENTNVSKPLTKGQKKNLREKEKKLKLKQEQEQTGITEKPIVKPEVPVKKEPVKPETPEEKFNRQIEWAIYQLVLGQQRPDTDKQQFKESENIINKLKSDKIHDAKKIALMQSVFGKNLDKVMKQYPMPKKPVTQSITNTNKPSTSTESTTASNNNNNNNNDNNTATTTTTTTTEATSTTA